MFDDLTRPRLDDLNKTLYAAEPRYATRTAGTSGAEGDSPAVFGTTRRRVLTNAGRLT
jgi:hypothetical protein